MRGVLDTLSGCALGHSGYSVQQVIRLGLSGEIWAGENLGCGGGADAIVEGERGSCGGKRASLRVGMRCGGGQGEPGLGERRLEGLWSGHDPQPWWEGCRVSVRWGIRHCQNGIWLGRSVAV